VQVAPGTLLAGRYLVGDEVGRGGMGAVYGGTDLRTGGAVAIKVLLPVYARDPVYRERLRREAQAAAALTSPRVVRVVDLDADAEPPFIVLEFVAGETLQERLRREGRLPPGEAVAIVLEIARALEDAHAHGIVHRDLKPQNVKLVDGQIKVLDFGVARVDGLPGLTHPGSLVGTPAFSAPEWASGTADVRTDLYALGIILYALLEGQVPFRAPTALAVLRLHESAPLPQAAHAPPALQAVLARCLAKRPRDRYQTPSELVAVLRVVASTLPAPPAPAGLPFPAPSPAPGPETDAAGATLALPGAAAAAPPTGLSQTLELAPPPPPEASPAGGAETAFTARGAPPLPEALSSFVGREREVAAVQALLRGPAESGGGARLVTLTGAGGAGKSRLALRVAAESLADYPDGARLVELASLAEPALVPQAVAAALDVREAPGVLVAETLVQSLASRRLLLVLDNCEHLVDACAALVDTLLRGCPRLQVLATSREALSVPGETVWPVPALSVPAAVALPLPRVAESEAVRLFAERAASTTPGFALSERNAPAVAEIVRRLDGIPLAIELAAARVRALSVQQIAARLDSRLRLLTSGSRSALPHQQTLRTSIDWSYDLLSGSERRLLTRLAVFAGGWTLEAAEAVCAGDGAGRAAAAPGAPLVPIDDDVLDVLSSLVDKSLVLAGEGEPGATERRYGLLETVRQYAVEKLTAGGEAEATRARHAAHFLALAEAAEPALNGPEQSAWLGRLEREHDNFRAVLRWAVEGGDADAGLRLGSALAKFWTVRGYQSEGQRWLDAALANAGGAAAAVRARAGYAAGRMARARRDYPAARRRYEDTLALWREAGDQRGIALALASLGGVAGDQGEAETSRALHEEALVLRRAAGDRRGVAQSLNYLGMLAYGRGDYAAAARLQEESLSLNRDLRDVGGVASALLMLGQTVGRRGDLPRAIALCSESLDLFREVGNRLGVAMAQRAVGQAALDAGDRARAEAMLVASLASARALQDPWAEAASLVSLACAVREGGDLVRAEALAREGLAQAGRLGTRRQLALALETLAGTAAATGRGVRAARLFGAAAALRDSLGMPPPAAAARHHADVARVEAALGAAPFAAHLAAGRLLTLDQAVAEATLDGAPSAPPEALDRRAG
jgi:non-specific serine/threonine protein kinase